MWPNMITSRDIGTVWKKGRSILCYNHKNGYVFDPGIVDRMEMLKLLHLEALEHDDGLEYYFTDGTRAF